MTVRVQLALQTVRELVRVVGLAPPDAVEPFEIREARARDVGEALATRARRDHAAQRRHRQRCRPARVPGQGRDGADRRSAGRRRLPRAHGPAGLSRGPGGGEPDRGEQGPVRREEPGRARRRGERRDPAAAGGLARHRQRDRRLGRHARPRRRGVCRRPRVVGPRRCLYAPRESLRGRRWRVDDRPRQLRRECRRWRAVLRGVDRVGAARDGAAGGHHAPAFVHAAVGRHHPLPVPPDGRAVRQRRTVPAPGSRLRSCRAAGAPSRPTRTTPASTTG